MQGRSAKEASSIAKASEIASDGTAVLEDVRKARAAARNRGEARDLLERLYPRVRAVVRMLASDPALIEELTQQAMMEIYTGLRRFRGESGLETWAGSVAYRSTKRQLGKQRRFSWTHAPQREVAAGQPGPERVVERTRVLRRLEGLLDGLSEVRRLALGLHLVEGYSVAEVAEMTAVSPNTVKDRLRCGLKELREALAREPELERDLSELMK